MYRISTRCHKRLRKVREKASYFSLSSSVKYSFNNPGQKAKDSIQASPERPVGQLVLVPRHRRLRGPGDSGDKKMLNEVAKSGQTKFNSLVPSRPRQNIKCDVTRRAHREDSPIVLRPKPHAVTRKARKGLETKHRENQLARRFFFAVFSLKFILVTFMFTPENKRKGESTSFDIIEQGGQTRLTVELKTLNGVE